MMVRSIIKGSTIPKAPQPAATTNTYTPDSFGATPPGTGPTDAVLPPAAPIAAPPPATTSEATGEFGLLNAAALEDALASIEAQYGLTRAQLLADKTAVGQEYQLLFAQANQARTDQLKGVEQAAQERGITRSGINAEAQARTISESDQQLAQLTANRTTGEEAIDSQLSGLTLQQQLEEQQAERKARMDALNNEVLQALFDAGV